MAIAQDVVEPQLSARESGQLTHDEVVAVADATALHLLGVSAEEAFAMLDAGELEGTMAASALRSLRFLLAA